MQGVTLAGPVDHTAVVRERASDHHLRQEVDGALDVHVLHIPQLSHVQNLLHEVLRDVVELLRIARAAAEGDDLLERCAAAARCVA